MANVIRTVICPCGNDSFERTFDFSGDVTNASPIWRCGNCRAETPRAQRHARSLNQIAWDKWLEIRAAWKPVNEALHAKVEAGAPSGCILIYSSTFNHHMEALSSDKKLTRFMLKYHIEGARKDLSEARKFVGM